MRYLLLLVPLLLSATPKLVDYKVKAGDTAIGIAKQHKMTLFGLSIYNHKWLKEVPIHPGDYLKVVPTVPVVPKVPKVVKIAKSYIGVRYKWGGDTHRGIDCSGLVQQSVRKATGVLLERTSTEMYYEDRHLKKVKHPRVGDLVFFRTNRRRRGAIGHVGIVINPQKKLMLEAYAAGPHRVRIASYNTKRRHRQLAGFRRVIK